MKRIAVPLAALVIGIRTALLADVAQAQEAPVAENRAEDRAEVSLYLFDQDTPVADAEVLIDDAPRARTNTDGAARLTLAPGPHRLSVRRDGSDALAVDLQVRAGEVAEIIATLYPDSAPSIFIESSEGAAGKVADTQTQEAAGPPGIIEGRIVGSEDGAPIANARVYVSGTPLDIQTDAQGRFRAELPAGTYSMSVIAANFSTQTLNDIRIDSEQTVVRNIELTPAGLELPEFVVLEPFVEGSLASFVEEKRTSANVADVLGAEQISRAGDSDVAGALKRVTGLTLVDGKFVYVRGLGERYSSALLNGAQVPSPDPTRRVVPLDLFPTELLSGIVIQKTYSADMPGEFAGGTIQLRTRGVPESFLLRASGTLGYVDGATGEDGYSYDGGDRDWLGYDDGTREAPDGLLEPLPPTNSPERVELARELSEAGYAIEQKTLGPETGFSFSIGDDFKVGPEGFSLGYIGAVRYSQGWDNSEGVRRDYSLQAGELVPFTEFDQLESKREIDTSVFFSVGAQLGELHKLTVNALQVRQTSDRVRITDGLQRSGNVERESVREWVENELRTLQFGGEHSFPGANGLYFDWLYSTSAASRYEPNTITTRYAFVSEGQPFRFQDTQHEFEELNDDVDEGIINAKLPFAFSDNITFDVLAGGSALDRDRDSSLYRFTYNVPGSLRELDVEEIFDPDNFGTGLTDVRLISRVQPTDFYRAQQSLDAYYLTGDARFHDWRFTLGARRERNDLEVIVQTPEASAPNDVARVESDDILPSAAITWSYSDNAQFRLGYSETLNRPDFRELATSIYTDPILGINVQGNPDLKQAEIENIDLRWEYYFSPTESFSVALFSKDILNPIELVNAAASDRLLGLNNADSAENVGIEFDLYKSLDIVDRWNPPGFLERIPWGDVFLGVNYARIDSEVQLGEGSGIETSTVRPLQGQSPYVTNLSIAYLPADGEVEATLLFNRIGRRIALTGQSGVPDVYEEPFNQLDFVMSAPLPWEGWKYKVRLRNLLDPKVEYTQGNLPWYSDRKGREIAISVEWRF